MSRKVCLLQFQMEERGMMTLVFSIHSVEVQSVGGSTNGYPIMHNSLIFVVEIIVFFVVFFVCTISKRAHLQLCDFCILRQGASATYIKAVTYAAAALHFSWSSS